ncbi:MAG: hypothetical protein LUD29_02805 [Clostridia bacterium]|nr:hypothetical protein [Clostridia bacterium]
MAEAVFTRMCKESGMTGVKVKSRGTLESEKGRPVYMPAAKVLKDNGYDFVHFSVTLTKKDVDDAGLVLVMDSSNYYDVLKIGGAAAQGKVKKLGAFTKSGNDIEDPWYTGDFERTFSEIKEGCEGFAYFLRANHAGQIYG